MKKQDYFIRSCIYNCICVVDKKETIYPLVQTVNALYLQQLEMQKTFTGADADIVVTATPDKVPSSEAIIVNAGEYSNLIIRCKEYNSSVIFEEPNNIIYLYRLAEEALLTYAKFALKDNGLQDYVDAMNEFN